MHNNLSLIVDKFIIFIILAILRGHYILLCVLYYLKFLTNLLVSDIFGKLKFYETEKKI